MPLIRRQITELEKLFRHFAIILFLFSQESQASPAKPGDVLNVLVTGLTEPGAIPDPKLVHVIIAGVGITPLGVATR